MNFRKTIKWTMIFLFLLLSAGGGVGYWFWMQSDELLKATIITHANTILPEGDFSLGTAHFDLSRRIRLYDVEVKPQTDQPPMVSIPEIILKIDNEMLAREQRVLVHKVTIERPTFEFVLRPDGTWNWQSLWPLPTSSNSLPEFEIQRATITLHWRPASRVRHTSVTLQNVDLHLIPSGHRHFHVRASGDVNFSGKINLQGKLDLDRETWSVAGEWNNLKAGPELGQLISTIFPQFDEKLHQMLAENSDSLSEIGEDEGNEVAANPDEDEASVKFAIFSANGPHEISHDDDSPVVAALPETARPLRDAVQAVAGEDDPERVATLWTGDTRQSPNEAPHAGSANSTSQRLWESLSASLDVDFEVSADPHSDRPQARVNVQVQDGRLTHPDLPFDLNEIFGTIIWDVDSLEIRELQATHGATKFLLQGKRTHTDEAFSSQWHVQTTNLLLDQQLRNVLRGGVARLFDAIQPRGNVDLVFDLKELHPGTGYDSHGASPEHDSLAGGGVQPVEGEATAFVPPDASSLPGPPPWPSPPPLESERPQRRWDVQNLLFTVNDASMMLENFPYPIQHIGGQIQQQGEELSVSLQGMAGKRPLVAQGKIHRPGMDAGVDLTISIDKVSIDDTLIAALPPDIQPTFNDLRLTGTMEGAAHIVRPSGRGRLWSVFVDVGIVEGTIQYEKFPLRMTDLSAHVIYTNSNHRWSVTDFKARRGKGLITGEAHFRSPENSHELSLTLKGEQLPLDGNLQQALPEELRNAWAFMDLRGTADASAIVLWNPGEEVDVSLPAVELSNGSLRLETFPFPLEQVRSKFRYNDGLVHFHSFTGRHDETLVRAKGMLRLLDDGGWNLHLEPFFVDDLLPNIGFRRALAPALKQAIEAVDLQNPLSLSGKVTFEKRGDGESARPITAAFDVETILTGNSIDVGIELKNIYGRINSSGRWDGEQCELIGTMDLESLLAHGYYITQIQGPYRFQNGRLKLGSERIVESLRSPQSQVQTPVPSQERIAGKAIGGSITLDAVVETGTTDSNKVDGNGGRYNVVLTLSDGKLETYAQQYLTDKKNLQGVVNAWMTLHGTTADAESLRGRGQMQISPAAIYELPVMMQVLQVLRPGPLEKAAFQYVFLAFNVVNQRLEFNEIDLIGDTISLRGRGSATFDGKLDVEFYSMMSQNQVKIPVISDIVGEATKGWVGVKVTGEVGHPDAEIQPLKNLDTALKTFLGAFDPNKSYPTPHPPVLNRAPAPAQRPNFLPALPTFGPPLRQRQGPVSTKPESRDRPTSSR